MTNKRSFKNIVERKCYDGLYHAAEDYLHDNWESMDLYTKNVHRIGSVELDNENLLLKANDVENVALLTRTN